MSLERARAAKAERAAQKRTHRCPQCGAEVVTFVPAEVFHRCPKRAATARTLQRYEQVEGP